MRRDQLSAIVREDLSHIPRGDVDQNTLRMIYTARRRHRPLAPRVEVLQISIAAVQKTRPGFSPEYDRDYFGNCAL